jgi:hypothetical protein
MSEKYNSKPGPLPPGFDTRFISSDVYIEPLVFTDNSKVEDVHLPEEVPNKRLYFGSNCPEVTIPRHPMWDCKRLEKK